MLGKDVKKKEPLCTVGRNVNGKFNHWKTVWRFLKKLKIEISYDLVFPLLGTYPKKTKTLIQKDRCTACLLHIIYNSQDTEHTDSQVSSCRYMDKEDVVYMYNGISLSRKKE